MTRKPVDMKALAKEHDEKHTDICPTCYECVECREITGYSHGGCCDCVDPDED